MRACVATLDARSITFKASHDEKPQKIGAELARLAEALRTRDVSPGEKHERKNGHGGNEAILMHQKGRSSLFFSFFFPVDFDSRC